MQNIHIIYTQYTNVQSVYIIRQAIIDKRTKPFCFYEWYWIHFESCRYGFILARNCLSHVLSAGHATDQTSMIDKNMFPFQILFFLLLFFLSLKISDAIMQSTSFVSTWWLLCALNVAASVRMSSIREACVTLYIRITRLGGGLLLRTAESTAVNWSDTC